MNLKTIRKNKIVATLKTLGKGGGYQNGATWDVDGPTIAAEAENAIAYGAVVPRMTLDTVRHEYILTFHDNHFYTFKAA